jgi:hypothetical protein
MGTQRAYPPGEPSAPPPSPVSAMTQGSNHDHADTSGKLEGAAHVEAQSNQYISGFTINPQTRLRPRKRFRLFFMLSALFAVMDP